MHIPIKLSVILTSFDRIDLKLKFPISEASDKYIFKSVDQTQLKLADPIRKLMPHPRVKF